MKINRVTLTGADNKVSGQILLDLQNQYSFVEWGILFSKSKEGQQRYPSKEHIDLEFINSLNLSAHFCGWYSKEVLEKQNFELISKLHKTFKRVQINYNFSNSNGWNLIELIKFAQQLKNIKIILQYNKSNYEILDYFIKKHNKLDNIDFLYDGSGGRGTLIKTIQEPINNHYTGYSGGLDVDNIENICETIKSFNNENEVWIDMESGIRTDNEFDLKKVKAILEKCSYVKNCTIKRDI